MRLRNIPGADAIVSASPFFIREPRTHRDHWFCVLGNERPIHIEIGMGKGQFLMELARRHPDINYIGIERYTSVLLRAIQRFEREPLPNVHFLCVDASALPEIFAKGEVDRIYLNFSDPWPKDRHARRRLTSNDYLARYAHILAEDGEIEFKTDNQKLFDFSVEEINSSNIWKIDLSTRDLHNDEDLMQDNVMSEYEEKFSALGNPIYKLTASYRDGAQNILPPLPDISRQPNPWETATNGHVDSSGMSDSESSSACETKSDTFPSYAGGEYSSSGCLKVSSWCDGQAWDHVYNFIVRIEHSGSHHSYGQGLTLELSEPVSLVEAPGDVHADTDGRYVHIHRNNELNEEGLTEIWIRLSADIQPSVTHIYDISCLVQ